MLIYSMGFLEPVPLKSLDRNRETSEGEKKGCCGSDDEGQCRQEDGEA
jgi:hypothetical protein